MAFMEYSSKADYLTHSIQSKHIFHNWLQTCIGKIVVDVNLLTTTCKPRFTT